MELLLSSAVLAFLLLVGGLLVGAFMDFLVASWAAPSVYHAHAFAPEPQPTHTDVAPDLAPPLVAEYERAA